MIQKRPTQPDRKLIRLSVYLRGRCAPVLCLCLLFPDTLLLGQDPGQQPVAAAVADEGSDDEVKGLSFDDIKFEMDKNQAWSMDLITQPILDLRGKRISLRGYILPSTKQSGITSFVFVRDNQECCFGPGAALYDCVLVRLQEDHSVDFTVRPVKVEGDFMIKEYKVGGQVMAIYRMKNAVVSQ